MIEAKNLRKIYKTKKGVTVNALDGVSLKLPKTGMVFILGKSGSGKSTLLNVLGGLDSFDSGEIIIKGTSTKDFKQSHFDSYRNTYIGFIFQEYNILEELTVGANVALAIELQGRKATNEEVNAILREVDLDGYGARKPNELSGGQKQRVAIARALVKKPEIIMADEPTGALDSATGKQVFDTLKKLSSDKLVLIVSHDREFSEQYADRIIELKDGVIISDVEKIEDTGKSIIEEDDEQPIVFDADKITVKAGYELTEEDRLLINKHLAKLSTGADITVDKTTKRRFSASDFKPTDESAIEPVKDSNFKLIKSKLSIKNAFKLGSGALNHKKVRLVFTILLSVVAFTLFGLADTIAAYDNIKTATNSIYDTGVNYASYVKAIKLGDDSYSYWMTDSTLLTPEDIELINSETGTNSVGIYSAGAELNFKGNMGSGTVDGVNLDAIFPQALSGLAAADQNLLDEHGFNLVGRLPDEGKNEIVLTKYIYDYFSKCGYLTYTSEGAKEFEIKSEQDLIGKKLNLDIAYNDTNAFEIVGIVDTGFDYSRYEKLADDDAQYTMNFIELMALTSELQSAQSYSFACVGFVNPKLISDMINEHKDRPDRVTNGSIQLYQLVDDSMIVDDGWVDIYGDKGDNVIASDWYQYINSLDKVKDSVVWIGEPLDSLAENQVILTASAFRYIAAGGYVYTPEFFWDVEKLVGFEKVMSDNSSDWGINFVTLETIFDNIKYYTAIKLAYEDRAAAENVFRTAGWDDGRIEAELSGTNIYRMFAELTNWGSSPEAEAFNAVVNNKLVESYVNELVQRYSLSDYLSNAAVREKLISNFTHAGKEYPSYDINRLVLSSKISGNLRDIAARKYAAENFEDAKRYYMQFASITDPAMLDNLEAYQILEQYAGYVAGNPKDDTQIDFTPSSTVDFTNYEISLLSSIYEATDDTSKRVLTVDSYYSGEYKNIKNIEIVGIAPDFVLNEHETRNYIVLGEDHINSLFGANRGGIYDCSVGKMPTEKSAIGEIVEFSKTYTINDGSARYQLTNNVTLQLDMVDEILDILGSVFIYVGIGFAVFASLMLTNFIGTSIAYKKQDIGILRAIGSRSADVFRIFFAESFIIAMINCVLASAGTLVLTLAINGVLRESAGLLITFLTFSLRQIGVLLLVSLGVAFIATFVPVWKIASMKPIDAIKNRK